MSNNIVTNSILSLAKEMHSTRETRTREDQTTFVTFDDKYQDIVIACHNEMWADDYKYTFIDDALYIITESELDNYDEIQERLYEIEADCYTSDLTEWLSSDNRRVYYLTTALEDFGIKDGFQALSTAQYLEKKEVAMILLDELYKRCEEDKSVAV